MNTKNMTEEQISAFADGELADAKIDVALAALRGDDGRNTWDIYHQIGDALRSDDMAFNMSADFTTRLAERLEQEPTIMAPVLARPEAAQAKLGAVPVAAGVRSLKRVVLQGMAAAAAVAAVAFVATPQLMVATKAPATDSASTMLASASQSASATQPVRVVAGQQGEVLRDPGIDEYLLAHQRFSPSAYNSASTAQYTRSATFAVDTDK